MSSNRNPYANSRLTGLRRLVVPALLLASTFSSAAISFVQRNSAVPQTPQTSVSVAYTAAQVAGDTNIVAVGWSDITANVTGVSDTMHNAYTLAIGPTRQAGAQSQVIWVAKNVSAAAANANTVTVTFDVAANYPDVRILAYRGLDTVSPVEAAVGAGGSGTSSSSGSLTTKNANDLLFAANCVSSTTNSAGSGFTNRIITSPDSDIAEDRIVTAAGSYSATAAISSGAWVMQLVALKAAGSQPVAATPTFTPLPGTFTSPQPVSLQDTTAAATIYYTTDGVTNPTTSSPVFNPASPIQVTTQTTIKAMAVAPGFANSAIATGTFTIQVPVASTPTFNPLPSTYTSPQSVSLLDATSGATIYYTTDGVTNPTTSSAVFNPAAPIPVSANMTIKAMAAASGFANSAVATGAYTIQVPAAATPTFSPVAGTYNSTQSVSLLDTTSNATIYYTTDGVTTPTTSSPVFNPATPIPVNTSTTIKAMATATNMTNSAVATGVFTLQAATPTFNPVPATYTSAQSVSLLDTTSGATIYYTTDGVTNPTTSSPVFNPASPIPVSANTTIKAMAVASGFANSAVATGAYTIQLPSAPMPTFTPLPGTYTSARSVSLQDTNSTATIYYTTDGVTNPTTSSPVFNPAAPIQVATNTTIKAMAAANGFANSAVATGAYTIQLPTAATPTFNPAPGPYTTAQSVSLLDATSGATIYYTTDGVTNPTTSSTVFNPASPIQVSGNTTIKAMAAASGFINSAVTTGAYTIGAPAPISFVQVTSTTPQSPQTTVTLAYSGAQTAGDTNIVVVGWSDSTSSVNSVTDSMKNTYSLAIGPTRQSGIQSQSIYVAPNIAAAGAGANTVTVTFSAAAPFPDIRILEYRGLSAVTPLDGNAGAIGTGTTSSAGPIATTSANDLLFAANTEDQITTGAGTGFTSRIITPTDANIAEDRIVTTTGSYSATATMSSGNWVMQMIALRAGSQIVDTQPPTNPANLMANAVGTQINLSWTASMDNVGVTAYLIERCQGSGCTNFAQINTSPTNSYSDSGLASSTTYTYQVRATDAAGNLSGYTNPPASATTAFSLTPANVTLSFNQTQQFSGAGGSASWAVDNIAGGNSTTGTISTSGFYTAPAAVGTHTVTATVSGQTANATVNVANYPGTFTRDVDKMRTGLNPNETVLTPANVNSTKFGKLFSYSIDGTADASPLYVPSVTIPGQGVHNVVYVATEHDSVYAFDADGTQTTPLWHVSFINGSSVNVVPPGDTGECCDISPEIGITGSPVIDPVSKTLYVVVKTKETGGGNTNYVHRLHALDLGNGGEKFSGPVSITATASGNGAGSSGGQIVFDNLHQNQRSALLLNNGVVYIAFGAHGDNSPYHGWILGYNASNVQQRVMSFNTSPNDNGIRSTGGGQGSGVWQSGDGIATDSSGDLYYVTGNGIFDVNNGGPDYGDSLMRLSPSGTVVDYFTPHDQQMMNDQDLDLGSGGVLLLPDQGGSHPHLALTAGKNGTIYVIDRDSMGHYHTNDDNQAVQLIVNTFPNGNKNTGNFKAAVYWNGHLFYSADADNIKSFALSNGTIMSSPTSQSSFVANYPGATLQVSANGNSNGILWAIQRIDTDPSGNGNRANGVLHAFNATDLTSELYNSNQASGGRDTLDFVAKWSAPLIANGKVYVASETRLTGFGLLP